MACVLAILTLHAGRVLEEFTTEGTSHDAVELLDHELVPKLLLHFFFPLPHSAFAVETDVERSSILALFGL